MEVMFQLDASSFEIPLAENKVFQNTGVSIKYDKFL